MKKMFKSLVAVSLLALSFSLFGCGEQNAAVPLNDYSRTGTLQGKIIDANTGKAVAFDPATYKSENVKMYLIRGTENQKPAKYVFDKTDTVFAGEYAFTGIPYVTNAADATYKLVVDILGYQRFEAELSFLAGATLDTALNRLGNIYLFPVGVNAVDYKARVMYNGKPVPSASVVIQQNTNNNAATTDTGNRLVASAGLLPMLTGTTDADGFVTLAGTSLVLGGQYSARVLPFKSATFEGGVQLELTAPVLFIVGTDRNTDTFELSSLEANAGLATGGLYITKTEPSLENTILTGSTLTAGGVLKVYFNRTVQLNNATSANSYTAPALAAGTIPAVAEKLAYVGYWATLGSINQLFTTDFATTLPANVLNGLLYPHISTLPTAPSLTSYTAAIAAQKPVVASLDTTKTILTLTPQFVTGFDATKYFDLKVTFSEPAVGPAPAGIGNVAASPTISPEGHPEKRYNLFGNNATSLRFNNNNTITNIVTVTGSRP